VNQPSPPPERQILALLTGRALQLACEWSGKTTLDGSEYASVFTVEPEAVHDYVLRNGVPRGAWSDRPGSHDGLYMVEDHGKYSVYYQERGIMFDESFFRSRREAEVALVNQLLAHCGAGLYVARRRSKNAVGRLKLTVSRLLGRGTAQ